jgi:hypothetical protein
MFTVSWSNCLSVLIGKMIIFIHCQNQRLWQREQLVKKLNPVQENSLRQEIKEKTIRQRRNNYQMGRLLNPIATN